MKSKWIEILGAAALLGTAMSISGVSAQSIVDQYRGAKTSGLVGEKMDGYIESVSAPSASIAALVSAINIKRKDIYFGVAQQTGSRPDDAAFAGGCTNIKNTKPGEYYQAPDGSWVQRTAGAPRLNVKCPQ
jgi:uncharacterized protein